MNTFKKHKIKFLILLPLLLLSLFFLLSLSKKPLVDKVYIQPQEVKDAVEKYQYVSSVVFGFEREIDVELSSEDLTSIFKAASHLTPNINVEFELADYGAVVFGTLELNNFISDRYLNFSCLLIPDRSNSIDSCKVGIITIPGYVVKFVLNGLLVSIFDPSVNDVFVQLLKNFEIRANSVHFTATKSDDLKKNVKSGLSSISSFIKSFRVSYSNEFDPEIINSYLMYMLSSDTIMHQTQLSISEVFNVVFQHAKERSERGDARKENEYALWSVAIAFANPRFAEVLDVNTFSVGTNLSTLSSKVASLNGRNDLALHFLYAAIIERVGNEAIANSMGELKELFDANQGGSGFDLSDLAADIAGARFSNFISSSKENAIHAQHLLVTSDVEDTFFPNVSRYRSIKWQDFDNAIGNTGNAEYSEAINKLQAEVNALALYKVSPSAQPLEVISSRIVDVIPWASHGVWLSVDTHIHTTYSDGGSTIKEISDKAKSYGCDAIAITDHADGDLHAGSLDYFLEIEALNRLYPTLSIISGLEWNLPPYEGREHATILFPEGQAVALVASQFRQQFDDYKNLSNPFASVVDGLKWLESSFNSYPVLPVVFYNHPSRKISSLSEVQRNVEDWSKGNRIFIGFSGAPGHQRAPGEKIGSYFHKFRTHDRWDPVVSEVGGVWDSQLGEGKILWGARAPSDFHGTRGDYWPCQFSETKVYSQDNSINSVIDALRRGSFFGNHGKVIRALKFELNHPHFERAVIMGESVTIDEGSELLVSIELELNELNWKGKPAGLDQVELIVVSGDAITSQIYDVEDYITERHIAITAPVRTVDGNMAIRWRGRSIQTINGDYMFYTNPIMVQVNSGEK